MADYVGFGVKVTVGENGVSQTEITIANKKYHSEKITNILDSVEEDLQEIQQKVNESQGANEKELIKIIHVYKKTVNPIDRLKLLHQLVQIGADMTTIAVNIIDIKNKLGL